MAECGEVSKGSASSASSSMPLSPEWENPPATGRHSRVKEKGKSRGRKRKGKKKKKRKYVSSSSSASSSSQSTSSESDTPDDDHDASRKRRKHFKMTSSKYSSKLSAKNPELGILMKHYSELVTLISMCVDTIADKLFAKGLISSNLHDQIISGQDYDRKKASKVVKNVKKMIEVNCEKMSVFIDVLKEERSFDDLTAKIISES